MGQSLSPHPSREVAMSYQMPIEDRSCCPFVSAPQSLFVPTASKSALGAVLDALSGEVTSDIFEDVLAHAGVSKPVKPGLLQLQSDRRDDIR